MQRLPKEFVGRTIRAVLFIIVVIFSCAGISSLGLFVAAKYGLTTSRERVPLTALSIGEDGEVSLPLPGKTEEGEGWILRNSRGDYTLTLDGLVLETEEAAITVEGDLTIELKKDSGNWIYAKGPGIKKGAGTLVIKGEGSLEIRSASAAVISDAPDNPSSACRLEGGSLEFEGKAGGIRDYAVELAGSTGRIVGAGPSETIGIQAAKLKAEKFGGVLEIAGEGKAVEAGSIEGEKYMTGDSAKVVVGDL